VILDYTIFVSAPSNTAAHLSINQKRQKPGLECHPYATGEGCQKIPESTTRLQDLQYLNFQKRESTRTSRLQKNSRRTGIATLLKEIAAAHGLKDASTSCPHISNLQAGGKGTEERLSICTWKEQQGRFLFSRWLSCE
jgi:hypothetical protein